ncbi:MAG: phenylalanine ammonia-lyase [Candidatus Omnitrophica bacterium]|nr:phenylalanine ammonia-lyase [Candidatus Omnitrophota bacterium]
MKSKTWIKVSSWIILQAFLCTNTLPAHALQDIFTSSSHLRTHSVIGAKDGGEQQLFNELSGPLLRKVSTILTGAKKKGASRWGLLRALQKARAKDPSLSALFIHEPTYFKGDDAVSLYIGDRRIILGIRPGGSVYRIPVADYSKDLAYRLARDFERIHGVPMKVYRRTLSLGVLAPAAPTAFREEIEVRKKEIKQGEGEALIVIKPEPKRARFFIAEGHHRGIALREMGRADADSWVIEFEIDHRESKAEFQLVNEVAFGRLPRTLSQVRILNHPRGEQWGLAARDGEGKRAEDISQRLTVWFEEVGRHDMAIVGGKGANLGEMFGHGVPVPPGFIVTAAGYQRFLDANPEIRDTIGRLLSDLDVTDPHALKDASEAIQKAIEQAVMPEDLEQEVVGNYMVLSRENSYPDMNLPVAVRSSGTVEDVEIDPSKPLRSGLKVEISSGSSAGQQETFLNVRGYSLVLERYRDVLASLFRPNAISYRDTQIFLAFISAIETPQDLSQLVSALKETPRQQVREIGENLEKGTYVPHAKMRNALVEIRTGHPRIADRFLKLLEEAGKPYIDPTRLSLAVPIQRMIRSDVSLVAFSLDRTTGFTARSFQDTPEERLTEGRIFRITTSYGLGEAIVGGMVVPDAYKVHLFTDAEGREHVNIIEAELGAKRTQMVYLEEILEKAGITQEELAQLMEAVRRYIAQEFQPRGVALSPELLGKIYNGNQIAPLLRTIVRIHEEIEERAEKAIAEGLHLPAAVSKHLVLPRENFLQLTHAIHALLEDPKQRLIWTHVPPEKRNQFAATDEEIIKITRQLKAATDFYGGIRDMEGAMERSAVGLVQSRAVTTPSDIGARNVSIKRTFVPEEVAEEAEGAGKLLVKGVQGRNAFTGRVIVLDREARSFKGDYAREEDRIRNKVADFRKSGEDTIIVTDFTTPGQEPLMKTEGVRGFITEEGGDTSHAAIVSRELNLATITGINGDLERLRQEAPSHYREARDYLFTEDDWVTVDANTGRIYKGALPIETEQVEIDVDQLPETHFTKPGLIVANPRAMQEVSNLALYPSFYGISLARAEFILVGVGIHPRAILAYDNLKGLEKDSNTSLTMDERGDVEKLRAHPQLVAQIERRVAGYPSAREYYVRKFYEGLASMAAANGIHQKVLYRFNDFKQNELLQITGGGVFGSRERATMLGDRGTGWLLKEENREVLGLELEALKRVYEAGYTNIGAFFAFVRTPEELRKGLKRFQEVKMPLHTVGMMVELPSNVIQADEFADLLAQYAKETGKDVFFSFGTNDLTQTTRRAGREEPLVKALFQESHPAIVNSIRHVVYAVREARQRRNVKFTCGLCGQAIIKLTNPSEPGYNLQAAREIAVLLDSTGTDVRGFLAAVKLISEAELNLSSISEASLREAHEVAFGKTLATQGAGDRHMVVVKDPEDLRRIQLGDFVLFRKGSERIAVPNGVVNQAGAFFFEAQDLDRPWFREAEAQGKPVLVGIRGDLKEGQIVTADFKTGKIYEGRLPLTRGEVTTPDAIEIPEREVAAERLEIQTIRASDFYRDILKIHPLAFLYYDSGKLHQIEQEILHQIETTREDRIAAERNLKSLGDGQEQKRIELLQIANEKAALLTRLNRDLEGIRKIQTTLRTLIGQKGFIKAEDYYRTQLIAFFAKAVSSKKSEQLVYQTSDLDSEGYLSLRYGTVFDKKEENTPLGFGGFYRYVASDEYRTLLRWEFEAVKEARRGGIDNILIQLTDVRDVTHLKIAHDLLEETDLRRSHKGFKLGVRADNPDQYLFATSYADQVDFVSIHDRMLAQNYLAADLNNPNVPISEEDIARNLKRVVAMITTAFAKAGKPVAVEKAPPQFAKDGGLREALVFQQIRSEGEILGALRPLVQEGILLAEDIGGGVRYHFNLGLNLEQFRDRLRVDVPSYAFGQQVLPHSHLHDLLEEKIQDSISSPESFPLILTHSTFDTDPGTLSQRGASIEMEHRKWSWPFIYYESRVQGEEGVRPATGGTKIFAGEEWVAIVKDSYWQNPIRFPIRGLSRKTSALDPALAMVVTPEDEVVVLRFARPPSGKKGPKITDVEIVNGRLRILTDRKGNIFTGRSSWANEVSIGPSGDVTGRGRMFLVSTAMARDGGGKTIQEVAGLLESNVGNRPYEFVTFTIQMRGDGKVVFQIVQDGQVAQDRIIGTMSRSKDTPNGSLRLLEPIDKLAYLKSRQVSDPTQYEEALYEEIIQIVRFLTQEGGVVPEKTIDLTYLETLDPYFIDLRLAKVFVTLKEVATLPDSPHAVSEDRWTRLEPRYGYVDIDRVREVYRLMGPYLEEAPLIYSPVLSEYFFGKGTDRRIYLKLDSESSIGSYKWRGALAKVAHVLENVPLADRKGITVIAPSQGNHAQGVVLAANRFGVDNLIFVPKDIVPTKRQAIERLGGRLETVTGKFDDVLRKAWYNEALRRGNIFISPVEPWVIAGQGTVALEILEKDRVTPDVIVAPVGTGGYLAGIATVTRALSPRTETIGVQASGSDSMLRSLRSGKIVEIDSPETLADGAKVKRPGVIPFKIFQEKVGSVVSVSEEDIQRAIALLHQEHYQGKGIVAEGAGVLSVAALLAHRDLFENARTVVLMISGKNIEPALHQEIIKKHAGKFAKDGAYRNLRLGELTLKTGVIPDLWAMQVERYGDRGFLVVPSTQGYQEVSFNQVDKEVARLKKALYTEGVRPGDRIAFLSPNRPEFVETAMGVWGLGGAVVSMSFRAPPPVLEHMVSNSDATSLIVSAGPFLQAARDLKSKNLNIKKIFVLDALPPEKLQEGEISLATWQEGEAPVEIPPVDIKPEDVALILYTSGTTKLPKGVPLTHQNLLYNREASRLAWEGDFTDEDMTLGWLPFFHVMGLPFEFLGNLYVGAKYAFPRLKPGPPTPDQLLASLRETKANVFYTVPWMLEGFQAMAEKDPTILDTLGGLKFIMSGGVVLSEATGKYFQGKGVNVIQGEGMTDVGGAIFLGDPKKRDWRTLRVIPGVNADFVSTPGLEGKELVLDNSPTVTAGYLKNEEATKDVFKEPERFHTGDLFQEVEGGYVYVGRNDEIFAHPTGEKTNPLPIEMALEDSPLIQKAALVGHLRPYNIAIVQPNYAAFKGKQWMDIEEAIWGLFEDVNQYFLDYSRVRRENIVIMAPGEEPLPLSPKGSLIRPQIEKRFAKQIEELYTRKEREKQVEREKAQLVEKTYRDTKGLRNIVKQTKHRDLVLALAEGLKRTDKVVVTGEDLTIPHVAAVAQHGVPVSLTDSLKVRAKVDASVEWLAKAIAEGRDIYGVNRGYGGSAGAQTNEVQRLQAELIRFLNSSFGPTLPEDEVRGAMLIRANSNIKGYSGLRWLVLENLVALLNKGVTPVVPNKGSITASGDLSPLSHMLAVLMGKETAKARYQGKEISAREALQITGIEPIALGPKEGLAFVNGTSVANALATHVLYDANILALLAQATTALSVETLIGTNQSYDPVIQAIKPHLGQIEVGENLLHLLKGSRLSRDELDGKEKIERGRMRQDRYGIRTAPQAIGPQLEVVLAATEAVTTEMNSVTDNPIIDVEGDRVLHGGNFQGTPLGVAMENTRLALSAIGQILFAQYTELHSDAYNNGLLKNLAGSDPNLDFGDKGSEIGMASYQSELEYLANPVTTHVKNAELGNQDVNSLALISARYTQKAVGVLQLMLVNHLYSTAQAVDLRNIERIYQNATEEAIAKTVEETLPSVVTNWKDIAPLMTAHLVKKAKTIPPYYYAFTSSERYKPLFDPLAGEIDDILRSDPKAVGSVEVNLVNDAKAVAGYYKVFMELLAKRLDLLLPQAKERALQQGGGHLLGNTRPLYEFIRRDLQVGFNDADKDPGPEKEKILEAIQDGRIVKPLFDAFFPLPTVEEWKASQAAEKSAKYESGTDGGTKYGAVTQAVVDRVTAEVDSLKKGQKLSDKEQKSLADTLARILTDELLPRSPDFLKEIGILDIIAKRKVQGLKGPTDYPRVVIHLDPQKRFELSIIAYLPGQGNPIHNHGGNACVFCIVGEGRGKERRFRMVSQTAGNIVSLEKVSEESIRKGSISKITRVINPVHQVINDGDEILFEVAIYAEPLVETGIHRFDPIEEGSNRFRMARFYPSAGGHSFEQGTYEASRDGGREVVREPTEESIVEVVPGVEVRRTRVENPKANVLVIEPLDENVRQLYRQRGDVNVDVLRTGSEIFKAGEDYYQRLDQKQFLEIVRKGDYDYITGFTNLSFDKEVMDASPHLKGILQFSIGYNNVDREEARKRGIFVTNAQTPTGSPLTIAMAELNIGKALNANYLLTDSISQEKIGKKKLEEVLLAAIPQHPQAVAEILWGELLRQSLRLGDMYQFVRDGKYCGCGVGPEATILHDQLGADPEVGVKTSLGIVGMNEVGKRLAEFANAHGIASIVYFAPEDQRLTPEEESKLRLTYFPIVPKLHELREKADYVIRLPGTTPLDGVHHTIVDPEDLWVKSGREGALFEKTLAGQTLGIAGFGRIGQAVASRAAALGMKMLTFEKNSDNIARASRQGIQVVDKDTLAKEPDIFTYLFDLNSETKHWVNREFLAKTKPKAIHLNTSRGGVINEEDMIAHLKKHPEAQGHFDVLTDESNTNGSSKQGLFELSNVKITGHTGSAVIPVRRRMQEIAFENLSAILDGSFPKNPVPGVPVEEVLANRMFFEAIQSANASDAVRRNVVYDALSKKLTIQRREYDLNEVKHIYVVGYGKVVAGMAEALHKIFGNRITAGVLSVDGHEQKEKYRGKIGVIQLYAGQHPTPGLEGAEGTEAILKLLAKATPQDMVITLISGGGSAIGALPVPEIPLKDLRELYQTLEDSGMNIHDKNIIRKHVDQRTEILKLGGNAKYFVNLLGSDVPYDRLEDIASGYTVGDRSTFQDAKDILVKRKLWDKVPLTVRDDIEQNIKEQTQKVVRPSDTFLDQKRFQSALLFGNRPGLERAAEVARSFGLKTVIIDEPLTQSVEKEADRMVSTLSPYLGKEPVVLLWGGEPEVEVPPGAGEGGRNSHLALTVANLLSSLQLEKRNLGKATFLAGATDGKDGRWGGAGAVVTSETVDLAQKKGLDPEEFLRRFKSGAFAKEMGIHIITGPTGTNIMDMAFLVYVPKRAADGGGKEFRENQAIQLAKIQNEAARGWVSEMVDFVGAGSIKVILNQDDIQEAIAGVARTQEEVAVEIRRLTGDGLSFTEAVQEVVRPGHFIRRKNGTSVSFSDVNDVARMEKRTFVLSSNPADKGRYNNHRLTEKFLPEVKAKVKGSYAGKTMYVVPVLMGLRKSPVSQVMMMLTDNPYVFTNQDIMAAVGEVIVGEEALVALEEKGGKFIEGVQATGDLEKLTDDDRYFVDVVDQGEVWSFGSAYGGNAILGKKHVSLRIAGYLAAKQGWLVEHMAMLGFRDKTTGGLFGILDAAPSASGKTNFAMLQVPAPLQHLYGTEFFGDDITWSWVDEEDHRLHAINPERGLFGVAPDTNERSNAVAMEAIGDNTGTVFTNVAYNVFTGEVWWRKLTKELPTGEGWINWRREPASPATHPNVDQWAHPNSRFTTRITNVPNRSPKWNDPKGLTVHAFFVGGKMSKGVPLIYQSRDLNSGLYDQFMLIREATAAASDVKVGAVEPDPVAMKPFFGLSEKEYLDNQRAVIEKLGENKPLFFHVNWFQKGADGNFLWPGYSWNTIAVIWATERIKGNTTGKGEAVETSLGYMPTRAAIERILDDLLPEKMTAEDKANVALIRANLDTVLGYDAAFYGAEAERRTEYLKEEFVDKGFPLPDWIFAENDRFAERVQSYAQDGGKKEVSLAEAVTSLMKSVGPKAITLSKMFEEEPLLDELNKTDEAHRGSIRTLYTILVRELFSRQNKKLDPKRIPMPVEEDILHLEIGSRMDHISQSTILLLSASRLLDEDLTSNPDVLSYLLKQTEGFLFFAAPEFSTPEGRKLFDELSYAYGAPLVDKMAGRFKTRLDQLPEKPSAVFLLTPADQEAFGLEKHGLLSPVSLAFGPHRKALISSINEQKVFTVPLKTPVDFLKEVYLGTSLASQMSLLREDRLEDLDTTTKLLLVEVTQGFGKAGKLMTSEKVQNELAEAKRIATMVLKGL